MQNCEIKYGEITHSISTANVRVSAIQAFFQLEQQIIGLKDTMTGMIVFPNENGTFQNLEAYATFVVECSNGQPESHGSKVPENVRSDSSSSDMDFRREAYRLATKSKKCKGKNGCHLASCHIKENEIPGYSHCIYNERIMLMHCILLIPRV